MKHKMFILDADSVIQYVRYDTCPQETYNKILNVMDDFIEYLNRGWTIINSIASSDGTIIYIIKSPDI